jgi:hypothetical protein
MHPPFGFALFYLRSVAPRHAYRDKLTGETIEGVSTGQIYWGAAPFVLIQIIMIGLTIAFPQMVMHYKGTGVRQDPSDIRIERPRPSTQPGAPNFGGAPSAGPNFGAPTGGPNFGPRTAAPAGSPSPPSPPAGPNFGGNDTAPAPPAPAPAPAMPNFGPAPGQPEN